MGKFISYFLLLAVGAATLGLVPALGDSGSAIHFTVDATHAPQKILHVRLTIPASPGPLTLYYPKWIQGVHAPIGPITNLAGLKFFVNGQTLPWKRDLLDVYTFHIVVPPGAKQIEAVFDYLETAGPAGGTATAKLLDLNWYQVVLYPAGKPAAQLNFQAALRLPSGWKFGTALPVERESDSEIIFQDAPL